MLTSALAFWLHLLDTLLYRVIFIWASPGGGEVRPPKINKGSQHPTGLLFPLCRKHPRIWKPLLHWGASLRMTCLTAPQTRKSTLLVLQQYWVQTCRIGGSTMTGGGTEGILLRTNWNKGCYFERNSQTQIPSLKEQAIFLRKISLSPILLVYLAA